MALCVGAARALFVWGDHDLVPVKLVFVSVDRLGACGERFGVLGAKESSRRRSRRSSCLPRFAGMPVRECRAGRWSKHGVGRRAVNSSAHPVQAAYQSPPPARIYRVPPTAAPTAQKYATPG